jgi:hypothetical protein
MKNELYILVIERYERYTTGSLDTYTFFAKDEMDLISIVESKANLYIDQDEIQETLEEVKSTKKAAKILLDNIKSSNGDGCDYIQLYKLDPKTAKTKQII